MVQSRAKSVLFFLLIVTLTSFSTFKVEAAEPSKDRLIPTLKCVNPSPGWRLENHEASMLYLKNWEKLGFKLELQAAPNWVTFVKMVDNPWAADAFISDYNERPDRLEPDKVLTEFAAEQIGPGLRNFFGYNNPEFMKVLRASREELDIEKRRQLVWKAQEYIVKDIPSIATHHLRSLQPANKKKWDDMVAGPGLGYFNILNFTSVTPKTQDKNIVIGSVEVLSRLNPMHTPASNLLMFNKFIYDNLAVIGPNSDALPWAAQAWKAKDSKTIDVTLREGMTFHDGKPVTSEDVKFSFDYCKKYVASEYKSLVDPIQKVEVVDKLNIRFVLKEPYAPLFMTTFTTIPILPKHIWEGIVEKEKLKHPDQWANPKPIGSGPFRFSYIRSGEEFTMVKNPNHFKAPKVDGVTVVFPADREAEFLMLKKGTIDFIDSKGLNPVRAQEASQMDHLKIVELGGIHVAWLGFNLREGHPTRDYNIRHALAHTIPYPDIVNNILQGKGDAGGGFIAPANKFWHSPNILTEEVEEKVHVHQFDMEKARKILKDAGFEWDLQGRIYWPENYKITVLPN
jgi:peptide/nickel transport system substrate-binding protein